MLISETKSGPFFGAGIPVDVRIFSHFFCSLRPLCPSPVTQLEPPRGLSFPRAINHFRSSSSSSPGRPRNLTGWPDEQTRPWISMSRISNKAHY